MKVDFNIATWLQRRMTEDRLRYIRSIIRDLETGRWTDVQDMDIEEWRAMLRATKGSENSIL